MCCVPAIKNIIHTIVDFRKHDTSFEVVVGNRARYISRCLVCMISSPTLLHISCAGVIWIPKYIIIRLFATVTMNSDFLIHFAWQLTIISVNLSEVSSGGTIRENRVDRNFVVDISAYQANKPRCFIISMDNSQQISFVTTHVFSKYNGNGTIFEAAVFTIFTFGYIWVVPLLVPGTSE